MNGKVSRYLRKIRSHRNWSMGNYRDAKAGWSAIPSGMRHREFFLKRRFTEEQLNIIKRTHKYGVFWGNMKWCYFTPGDTDVVSCKPLVDAKLMSGPHQPSKDRAGTSEYYLLTEYGVRAARKLS